MRRLYFTRTQLSLKHPPRINPTPFAQVALEITQPGSKAIDRLRRVDVFINEVHGGIRITDGAAVGRGSGAAGGATSFFPPLAAN